MKIKHIGKLIKVTTFLKSIFTHSSFIFNIIYFTKFFDMQTRCKIKMQIKMQSCLLLKFLICLHNELSLLIPLSNRCLKKQYSSKRQ